MLQTCAKCRKAYQFTVSAFIDIVRDLKLLFAVALFFFRFTVGAFEAAFIIPRTIVAKFFRTSAR